MMVKRLFVYDLLPSNAPLFIETKTLISMINLNLRFLTIMIYHDNLSKHSMLKICSYLSLPLIH